MERKEVIDAFCNLSNEVMKRVFQSQKSADCFCGLNQLSTESGYQFSSEVFAYIHTAVHERMVKEGKL